MGVCLCDDKNCRTSANSHYGTAKQDIQLLRDCDIKVALEGMAWVVREMQDPSVQKTMIQRSRLIESPSQEFVNVCEALFCLIHGSEGGNIYDTTIIFKFMIHFCFAVSRIGFLGSHSVSSDSKLLYINLKSGNKLIKFI